MKIFISLAIILLSFGSTAAQELRYTTCEGCWNSDSLGNHRIVVQVTDRKDAVRVNIPWRRRDTNPQEKNITIHSEAGTDVTNISLGNISRESGEIYFEPVDGPGKYYVYYLKYVGGGRSNYPTVTYPPFVSRADQTWLEKIKSKSIKDALATEAQSIDELNSFFPMEVIAMQSEVDQLVNKNPGKKFLIFPESRELPIKMTSDLPHRWIKQGLLNRFQGTVSRGEHYAYQLGLYAIQDVSNIKVTYTDLKSSDGGVISADVMSCLNLEGVNWDGAAFEKDIDVKKGQVQALWNLIDIPTDVKAGVFTGTVTVSADGAEKAIIQIELDVSDDVLADGGVMEPWKHTRLTWLNSRMAMNDEVIAPYTPLVIRGSTISFLGRDLTLDAYGLPSQIRTYFTPEMTSTTGSPKSLLADGFSFRPEIGGTQALTWKNNGLRFITQSPGLVRWETINESAHLMMKVEGQIEFDGFVSYEITLSAKNDIELDEVMLQIPLSKKDTPYFMGLGERGGYRPPSIQWKWDVATKNQDGGWIGDVNGGIHFSLRDENYVRPLNTNFYLQKPLLLPTSWGNEGKGGITIEDADETAMLRAYSGKRSMKAGEELHYNFNLLITPFHTIDTDFQWKTRFYHQYSPIDTVVARKASVANIHHANAINPYINYPFIKWKEMKAYIDEGHSKGVKVKIYNTIRELSNRAYETHAMRSLGTEIYSPGSGGGFSWLQEHIGENYIAAWFVPHLKDAAIINSGMSRWHNYYVEGMNWLVKNVGIDGIYLDDVAFDRTTMKRIRRVLASERGPGIIDLHSANQFNKRDGFNNSANLYLEHFPYLNRLWFGEYFDYDMNPDFWLVEVSGIPFGLMGEMLEKGGNKWRGMVYGMTNRLPWGDNDPSQIWKFWDAFGMEGTEMIGYWSSENPVKTNNEEVKATVYKKDGSALIAIASWEAGDTKVKLDIDWKRLGMEASAVMIAPAIPDYQDKMELAIGESFTIPKGQGYLIILN